MVKGLEDQGTEALDDIGSRASDTEAELDGATVSASREKRASPVAEFLSDPDLEACAKAAGKSTIEYVNDQTKLIIMQKGIMEVPLTLRIRNEDGIEFNTKLKHPDTIAEGVEGVALTMESGLVVARSGPLFSGHMAPGEGQAHLPEKEGRSEKVAAHVSRIQEEHPEVDA